MSGGGTNDLKDKWRRASTDELRAWRAEALRLAEQASGKAEDMLRQAEVYERAAEELQVKAYEAEAMARLAESKDDLETAQAQREFRDQLRIQADDSYRLADSRGKSAMEHEREAYNHRELAARIDRQLAKGAEFEE